MIYTAIQLKQLIRTGDLKDFYNSREWRRLSRSVIKEYHGECYRCRQNKRYTKAVLVHHVKPLRDFPELAYSRTYNGSIQLMPLCHDCHEREHKRGIYAESQGFTTPERW